ncbi:DUF4350 domain-containing protein [Nostoc sp. FACHB-152]|uniref:DUF4350 domain-containing protein n=1 Tax=unclassified Nostoc TaxID=2593658 RepID=UPI001688F575|nr:MULTISPECIES: DUF4350 domain-containing protein [unclassified Nostoc]MBD2448711.1 DUF4350 domain-containing protein [Nostoc sp. FACHB-152]MBD2470739.1 DUF4350 domain-containing protein [Nostoc sp. FACHB-145]
MKRSNRIAWIGAIALGVIIILSLVAAPNTKIYTGSTYNRSADGYGAWYAFMQQQNIAIQRWQKPLENLKVEKTPITLLRVSSYPREPYLLSEEHEFLKKGNTLVILGVKTPVTEATFHSLQQSTFGNVKIATRRRYKIDEKEQQRVSLGDRFGAIVWEEQRDPGKVIFSTTPYLAANAYQDNLSNFQYLASLVKQKGNKLFVDEYIHGYKDADVRESEGESDLLSYFAQTPVLPMLMQTLILLLVLIWAKNQRFGKPIALETQVVDNSQAYIQALATVLQKAESSDFVIEMVGKEEQLQLQKALGLGTTPLERQTLLQVWQEKTGTSAVELDAVLKLATRKQRISERELLSWLAKWRTFK